jgi:hypothetical protein
MTRLGAFRQSPAFAPIPTDVENPACGWACNLSKSLIAHGKKVTQAFFCAGPAAANPFSTAAAKLDDLASFTCHITVASRR